MRSSWLGLTIVLLKLSTAVFVDEAWNTDYHFALLGLPQKDTTFFHQPNPSSKASLIYTLSEEGIIGAVNPRDGALVWRQPAPSANASSLSGFLRAGESQDVVVAGTGQQISAFAAADGRLAWSISAEGNVEDLEILELTDGKATPGVKDAIAIFSGPDASVQRIDGSSGSIKWTHSLDSGDVPYQVSASATNVVAIMLHKTMLGYIKIKVISLDPVDGRKMDEYVLSSDSELASADTIIAVGANSASPIIAWTDAAYSVLKINIIGTKGISTFNIDKHDNQEVRQIHLQAPNHINSLAHFLVHYQTATSHWADIFHIDLTKNKIEKAYSLPKLEGLGTFSTSSSDANVYFTRITPDELVTVSSVSHSVLGRWSISGLGISAVKDETIVPVHAVSEISVKSNVVSAVRSAVLLSTGDWVLFRDGSPIWQRPEVLAGTVSAVFTTRPEVEAFARQLEVEADSNPIAAYLHRVSRHIQDLQRLPEVIQTLPKRFLNGLFGTTADSGLTGDTFGFHQIVACATKYGRVVALDAGSPDRILWNRQAVELKTGQSWNPSVKANSDGALIISAQKGFPKLLLNSSDGEQIFTIQSIEPTTPAPGNVELTLRNGELEAKKVDAVGSGILWQFSPIDGERIVSLVPRPVNDPVSSIGKVLGDRRVLYKYLNPNLAVMVTANDATRSASIYVLETITGATLHSWVHNGVDLEAPISSIVSENWFAYSYTIEYSDSTPKGHQLVVGELFQSLEPNDRGSMNTKSNFSSLASNADPFVITKTYQVPETVSKLSVTQTRQGITSRQLLAVLPDSDSIVGIPYGIIDPRRPLNRDATTEEQMEGLMRYTPTIEFDPKWMLNHQREVIGVSNVITTPALIESTSLVFAYGIDIFGTRLSPSFSFDILGKDFNKFQMLATVAALAVATFVVAPLVREKSRWLQLWSFTDKEITGCPKTGEFPLAVYLI